MIYLDKGMVARLLLTYAYQRMAGSDIRAIGDYLQGRTTWPNFSTRLQDTLQDIFRHGRWRTNADDEDATFKDDIDVIMQRIYSKQSFTPLFDRVSTILQEPFARNVLGGTSLRMLRRAILLPDERAAAEARLGQKEATCVGCGKTLTSGECVTFSLDAAGNNTFSLKCANCAEPVYIGCTHEGCTNVEQLPARIKKYFQKGWTCPEHQEDGRIPTAGATVQVGQTNPATAWNEIVPNIRFVGEDPPATAWIRGFDGRTRTLQTPTRRITNEFVRTDADAPAGQTAGAGTGAGEDIPF